MGASAGYSSSVSEDVSSVLGSEVTGEIRAAAAVTTSGDNWGRAVTNGDCATPVTSVSEGPPRSSVSTNSLGGSG